MRSSRLSAAALLAGAFTLVSLAAKPPEADACGAFFPRKTKAESAPSLSLERTLIVFDSDKREQHFIREVVFRGSQERFGFVVPTPTKPSVHKVKKSPFAELEARFPFQEPETGGGNEKARSGGAPGGAPQPKVTVLEVKYLGSFTAFVLKATDAAALGDWLEKNDLASTPEGDQWLAEYVKREFFYVALRYEPTLDPKAGSDALRAETLRISFATPVAYYPYREPQHARGAGKERATSLWVVSTEPVVPVALLEGSAEPQWVRPFLEGTRRDRELVQRIGTTLDAEDAKLLPSKEHLVVQPFQDQKSRRTGYGDVVFLPEGGLTGDRAKAVEPFVRSTLLPSGAQ